MWGFSLNHAHPVAARLINRQIICHHAESVLVAMLKLSATAIITHFAKSITLLASATVLLSHAPFYI